MLKQLPMLFKRTENGNVQQWQIIVNRNSYHTIEGLVDGKLTTSKPTFCDFTNQGRANERTPEKQAEFAAKAKWKKQLEKGYVEDVSNIDNTSAYYEPMLAYKLEDHKDVIVYPCLISYKIDGIRCVLTRNGAQSRNGKDIVSIPHIQEELKDFFKKFPNAILDGELYNHELHDDFNKITSLVKKTKPSIEDLLECSTIIQYHIFDVPRIGNLTEKDKYSERMPFLFDHVKESSMVKFVKSYNVNDESDIMRFHDNFTKLGYEGAMIRIDGPYENKRSRLLLKVKKFLTEEFIIMDVREGKGNRTGMAGNVVCKTKAGKIFSAGINGDEKYCKELLINRDDYVMKKATVKFFAYTPDGVPRFPKIVEMARIY